MVLCKSCKHRVDNIQNGQGEALEICSKCNIMEVMDYIEVMRPETLQRLETPSSLKSWISVKDLLPEDGNRYMIYEQRGEHAHNCALYNYPYPCCKVNIAYYSACLGWQWSTFENSIPAPTHWMPLPEPPKVK